jgi:thioredoxin domain-containing protein 5
MAVCCSHPGLSNCDSLFFIDFCRQLDIAGYPTLNLYQDGKYLETFNQNRELDLLLAFLSKRTQELVPPAVVADAPAESPSPIVNPSGEVLVLSNENFAEEIAKGKVLVKFFAPWYE